MIVYFIAYDVYENERVIQKHSGNMVRNSPIESHDELQLMLKEFTERALLNRSSAHTIYITSISRL